MIKQAKGEKIVYIYSSDNSLDMYDLTDLSDSTIKPIPSKIYEIYKEIIGQIKEE